MWKNRAGWTCDPYAEMGFWSFHVDSLLWSVILGCVFLFVFKKATPKKDTKIQPQKAYKILRRCVLNLLKTMFSQCLGLLKTPCGPVSLNRVYMDFINELNGLGTG